MAQTTVKPHRELPKGKQVKKPNVTEPENHSAWTRERSRHYHAKVIPNGPNEIARMNPTATPTAPRPGVTSSYPQS